MLLISRNAYPASDIEEDISKSQQDFYACQLGGIQTVDNGQSDAAPIALALTNYCAKQYDATIKILARQNIDNSNERRMLTIDQNAKAIKIEASLHIVLTHRQGKSGKGD